MIKILIVDDHELIREGFKKILTRDKEMKLMGEARNSDELFGFLTKEVVDIIVLDISLPGKSGLEILKDLKSSYPEVRVLVLSMHPEERFAVRVLKLGAAGYLTKESAVNELVKAIRHIVAGNRYISPSLAEKLAEAIESSSGKSPHEYLSNREFEVMLMISEGKSVGDIADELCLSVNTVTSYRTRILEKMKMKSNADIIRYSIENQLVE